MNLLIDRVPESGPGWVSFRIDFEETLLRFRAAGDAVYRLSRFMIVVEPSRCAMDAGHALSIWRRQANASRGFFEQSAAQ